jgi:Raf kinase inhibitor-like YbhB/YbcL family protein
VALVILATVLTAGCGTTTSNVATPQPMDVTITDASGSFAAEFTCDGANHTPTIAWTGTPGTAKEITVAIVDVDTPTHFTHWLVYGLARDLKKLDGPLPKGAHQGKNDFGKTGYGGPCPPKGVAPHHYLITVDALDKALELADGVDRAHLEAAEQNHIVAEGLTSAMYARK